MSQKIGYARVSTRDQNLLLQIKALNKEGCEVVFKEKKSGVSKKRPEFENCLDYLRSGDTLVVWKLDRIGRSLVSLVKIVDQLKVKGVHLKIIKESIDTTTAAGKLFFHISAAFAEYERSLNRERTLAGLEAARAAGRVGGRPKGLTESAKVKADAAAYMYKSGKSITQIEHALQISKATIYKYLRLRSVSLRGRTYVENY